mmetsp:Transcript_130171/g.328611  ORF Transcript_130171/g.328611 Transcript_130171/m.328611 type:complete len:203 (-) Transcript_130171:8-616(-)
MCAQAAQLQNGGPRRVARTPVTPEEDNEACQKCTCPWRCLDLSAATTVPPPRPAARTGRCRARGPPGGRRRRPRPRLPEARRSPNAAGNRQRCRAAQASAPNLGGLSQGRSPLLAMNFRRRGTLGRGPRCQHPAHRSSACGRRALRAIFPGGHRSSQPHATSSPGPAPARTSAPPRTQPPTTPPTATPRAASDGPRPGSPPP